MAELFDARREQYCKLRAAGMKQGESYSRAGYRSGDRSNASKLDREDDIQERIAELRREEEQRLARLRGEVGDLPGVDELKRALVGASSSGNWSAAVAAARALSEMDGSAASLAPDRPQSVEEIVAGIDRHSDPVASLAIRMIAPRTSFERPTRTADDLDLIVRGVEHYLGDQLGEFAARLTARKV